MLPDASVYSGTIYTKIHMSQETTLHLAETDWYILLHCFKWGSSEGRGSPKGQREGSVGKGVSDLLAQD